MALYVAAVFVSAASLGAASFPAKADELVLGRWCDRMVASLPSLNRTVAIVALEDGTMEARSQFADGSSLVELLTELGGAMFGVVDSPSGDTYRVESGTGELQILDADGLIRTAMQLEIASQPGDCEN